MSEQRFEREEFIPASVDEVWRAITDPEALGVMAGRGGRRDPRPGGELVVRSGDGGEERSGFFEEIDADERRVSFWWRRGDDDPTRVEVELAEEDGRHEADGRRVATPRRAGRRRHPARDLERRDPGAADARPGGARRLSATADPAAAVFGALADPTRRRILSIVSERGEATATGLSRELPVTRQAIQKHLASLEAADLVSHRREGRESVYRATPEPLSDAVGWIAEVGGEWDKRLAALRTHLARN